MIRKLIVFLLMLPLFVLWLELHVLVNNLLLNLESPLDFVILAGTLILGMDSYLRQ
ncbi:Uncharacterised protein [Streptococcus pneumoniae]|nr:Uncharacterised protein [Streptococcus pneumoniae]